jgi:hypothetical protein
MPLRDPFNYDPNQPAFNQNAFVGLSPQPLGSSPYALTAQDNHFQCLKGSGDLGIINLPSVGVRQGEVWTVSVKGAGTVTDTFVNIQSADLGLVTKVAAAYGNGYARMVALIDAPSSNSDWLVIDLNTSGLWTPVIASTGTSFGTVTYTIQTGIWSRKNALVTFQGAVGWSNTSGSATGRLQIATLPYVSIPDTDYASVAAVNFQGIRLDGTGYVPIAKLEPASRRLDFYQGLTNVTNDPIDASVNDGAGTRYLGVMGSYHTDQP